MSTLRSFSPSARRGVRTVESDSDVSEPAVTPPSSLRGEGVHGGRQPSLFC
jgi:hypothetical protein